jgi:hypothetical protein
MIPSQKANHHYESKRCGLISTGRTLLIEDCGPKLFNTGSAKPARLGARNCDELATDRVENNHWFGSRSRAPISGVTVKVKLSMLPFVSAYPS